MRLPRRWGPVVEYSSPVTEIRKTATGVRVSYKQGGATKQIEASYCIAALPFFDVEEDSERSVGAVQEGGGREHDGWSVQAGVGEQTVFGSRTTTSMEDCRTCGRGRVRCGIRRRG